MGCQAHYCHPKIFELSCYLFKLALNVIDCSERGVWKEGFWHCLTYSTTSKSTWYK